MVEGHMINPMKEMLTSRYWQEYQVLCRHARAYGRRKWDSEADCYEHNTSITSTGTVPYKSYMEVISTL